MQADPVLEWQRLTEHYREMSDDELRDLAADFADLTDTAQQALRSEMRSRGLGDAPAPEPTLTTNAPQSNTPSAPATARVEPEPGPEYPGFYAGYFGRMPELVPDAPDGADDEGPHDYTWKTVLCDCDTNEQAQELSAALQQAKIECWVQQSREFGRRNPRVLVAADQLDQARAIAAGPIPPEIVAETQTEVPDFTPPSCPKCGAPDPVLEGVDPANSWKCEQCGHEWADSIPEESIKAGPSPGQPA
jgi:rubredoxin